jgi:predicted metal-dependent hydrolase
VAETGTVAFGSTTILFSIVRSRRRRKTIEITLDPLDGVVVSAPTHVSPEVVEGVVRRRAGWIIRKGTETILQPRPKEFVSGESLPYLGRQVRIFVEEAPVKRVAVKFDHWSFRISVPAGVSGDARRLAIANQVVRWYRRRAQYRLDQRVSRWSLVMGCQRPRILTRNQRQRWGSCSPDGTIRFNCE